MPIVLRLTQHTTGEQRYRIECALDGDGTRRTANVEFEFALTSQEQEQIRWYLEEYAENAHDPAPKIAAKIEARLREIGQQLFAHIFKANDDAIKLWNNISDRFEHVRVEIITEAQDAAALPWELLWDGHAGRPRRHLCPQLRAGCENTIPAARGRAADSDSAGHLPPRRTR